jgi:hypothetical protein
VIEHYASVKQGLADVRVRGLKNALPRAKIDA